MHVRYHQGCGFPTNDAKVCAAWRVTGILLDLVPCTNVFFETKLYLKHDVVMNREWEEAS